MTTDDTRRSDGQGLSEEERARAEASRMEKYGSTLTRDNVDRIIERIGDYPEIVAAVLAARGGNTDNGQVTVDPDDRRQIARLADAFMDAYDPREVVASEHVVNSMQAALRSRRADAAPAPTDNQRDDGLAERVLALADDFDREATSLEWASSGGEIVATAVKERRSTAIRLRAVVDGATTGDGEPVLNPDTYDLDPRQEQ